jgi:hypothetical protein
MIIFFAILNVANNVLIGVAIAVAIGVMLVVWGMKTRNQAQLVAQVPEVPVRNLADGTVHVYGKTAGDDRLQSPFTGVSCYYYKAEVEKLVKEGNQSRWVPFKNENGQRSFYLDDGTGRVLVDLQGVEFDLPQTLRAEIGVNSSHYCTVDPSLGIPRLSENQLHALLIADWGQARAAVQGMGAGGAVKAADKVLAVGEKMAEWGVSTTVDGVSINPGLVGESFRITETCLLADRQYSVIGTCEPNPNAKDEKDRKVIRKGKTEKTFLISLKTGAQLVNKLRLQGTVMMAVGVVLVIAAVAFVVTRR